MPNGLGQLLRRFGYGMIAPQYEEEQEKQRQRRAGALAQKLALAQAFEPESAAAIERGLETGEFPAIESLKRRVQKITLPEEKVPLTREEIARRTGIPVEKVGFGPKAALAPVPTEPYGRVMEPGRELILPPQYGELPARAQEYLLERMLGPLRKRELTPEQEAFRRLTPQEQRAKTLGIKPEQVEPDITGMSISELRELRKAFMPDDIKGDPGDPETLAIIDAEIGRRLKKGRRKGREDPEMARARKEIQAGRDPFAEETRPPISQFERP